MIFFQKFIFLFSSFIAGFALMTIELLSSRIVAPIIGSSVYTWTSVIGATILGLALGSLLGGYLADKYPRNSTLAIAFVVAGALTFLIPSLASQTNFITSSSSSLLVIAVSLSFFLFLLPSIAVGTLSPIILKLYAKNFSSIGKEYAAISSTWSFGSILGVFLTGFVFVSKIGSVETINIVAGILLLLAFVFTIMSKISWKVAVPTVAIVVMIATATYSPSQKGSNVINQVETQYYLAQVVEMAEPYSRALFLDFDSHSIETDYHPNEFYTEIYPIFGYLKSDIQKIHAIGGGAYTLPKNFAEHYSNAEVSVTEIDPEVKKIGEEYFGLDSVKIQTIQSDARVFLANTDEKFDLIFGDAFNSFISVPWHLMTREFNEQVKTKLAEGGIYAVNFIGAIEGDSAEITRSMLKTFSETFPNPYIFATGRMPTDIQNVILVGINGSKPLSESELKTKILAGKYGPVLAHYLVTNITLDTENGLILTDNFAPVERLMEPVMKKYFPNFMAFVNKNLGGKSSL